MAHVTGWTNNDYGPKSGETFYDLKGDYANSDWGIYNPIFNGGNEAGRWYTLTNTEWSYLTTYARAAGNSVNGTNRAKYTYASVNDVHGIIFFPDEFTEPTFVGGSEWGTINARSAWTTVIVLEDWYLLEAAGCIFLPATGTRGALGVSATPASAPTVSDVNSTGMYWSSIQNSDGNAYSFKVNSASGTAFGQQSTSKYQGYCVRLAHVVE